MGIWILHPEVLSTLEEFASVVESHDPVGDDLKISPVLLHHISSMRPILCLSLTQTESFRMATEPLGGWMTIFSTDTASLCSEPGLPFMTFHAKLLKLSTKPCASLYHE